MRRLVQPRDYASLILAEPLGRIFGRTIGRRYLIAPAEDTDVVEPVALEQVGQGNTTYEISDELLEALTDASRNMSSGNIGV